MKKLSVLLISVVAFLLCACADVKDAEYTVGIHAKVTTGTKIELMVYAGKR